MTAERLTRTDEIRLLTNWHEALSTRRAVSLAALWSADAIGLPILWNGVKAIEAERLAWNSTAVSCFNDDVLRYALRNVGFVAALSADMAK